jgi:histidine triad (HIT) family protein
MIHMEDSIFTKIIKGEVPSYKIYEDDRTYAFLDIHPIQPGHVLVIPRAQVEFAWDLEDEDYHAVMATAKKVARRLKEVFPDKERVAMHIEGLGVDHAHLKVFPFNTDEEFRYKPDLQAEPDHEALAAIAEKLKFQ